MMSCYQHLFCYHFINTFNFLSVPVRLLFEPTGLDESSPETRSFPCLCRIFTCHRRSSTSATMSVAGAVKSLLLLGRCAPSVKQNASKIIVKKLELDENLLMVNQNRLFLSKYFFMLHTHSLCGFLFQYFNKDEVYYAHDPKRLCKTGDVVLIQELPEKLTTYITHSVLQVVYPLGDVTDPITNKKVAALRCGTVCYRFVTLVVSFDFLHLPLELSDCKKSHNTSVIMCR